MCFSNKQYFEYVSQCRDDWANPDENRCLCGGGGWWLSAVDTWHKYPYHYDGQMHPEQADWEAEMADEYPGGPPEDDHEMCRKATARFTGVPTDESDLPFRSSSPA